MKMKGIVEFGIVLAAIIAASMVVSAITDPYPMDGYVLYPNGTKVGVGANITFTNQNTTEVIYDDTSASGWYSADAGNFPSGYQDGHIIKYETVYSVYINTTYHTVDVAAGSNTMNITLVEGGGGTNASVNVTDGSITFGNLQLSTTQNTVTLGQTQVIDTTGADGNQKIEIMLNSGTVTGTTNSTVLTFVSGSPGLNELLCQFKGGDVGSYTALTTSYQEFNNSMVNNTNANLDIQLNTPNSVSNDNYYDDYQFEITVRATLL